MSDSPWKTPTRLRRTLGMMLLPLLVLAGRPAHADDPSARLAAARKAFQHDLVTVLALRAEARPLLGAALLARTGQPSVGPLGFHRLIERAAAASDAGPAVNWVRLSDCAADAGNCPASKALRALERQAPDNAAVWLMRMGEAASNGDSSAAAAALRKAAAASGYDDYTGRSLQALADAVSLLPPPPATLSGPGDHATRVAALQVMMVFGIADAQPMPGFRLVASQCLPEAVKDDADRIATCLKLAHVLVWGSSPLARSLGLHLQSTLSTDPVERELAASDMRNLVWEVQAFSALQQRARTELPVARRLLALARRGGNQMGLMQAALRDFDIPLEAPVDDAPANPASAATHP